MTAPLGFEAGVLLGLHLAKTQLGPAGLGHVPSTLAEVAARLKITEEAAAAALHTVSAMLPDVPVSEPAKPSRAALITGGAQRLGAGMATHLASRGWDVVIHYGRSAAEATTLAETLKSRYRVRAATVHADITRDEEVATLVERAAAALPQSSLRLLINNASTFEPDALDTATSSAWSHHIATNVKSPLFLTQAFAKHLTSEGAPCGSDANGEAVAIAQVINMVDCYVLSPRPDFITYSIAKTALLDLTKRAAQSLGPLVRVNAIGPGPTLPSSRQLLSPEGMQAYSESRRGTILKRGSNVDDICGALDYFLDAPAVTGQLLCVDGGAHLAWAGQLE